MSPFLQRYVVVEDCGTVLNPLILKAGGIVHLPWHAFTNLPFQQHMLYVPGIWLGGMRTPQLIHWAHLPMIMIFAGAIALTPDGGDIAPVSLIIDDAGNSYVLGNFTGYVTGSPL